MRCSWLTSVLSLFLLSSAKTIIIDDSAGDPTNGNAIAYFPANGWISGAIGGCPGCPGPSTGIAYMNTWHAGIFNKNNKFQNGLPLSASVPFYGTSVWVNFILSNSLTNPTGITEMRFSIDGKAVGNFTHIPTGAGGFITNSTVFLSETLSLGLHTLVIENGIDKISLAILDSISYSTPDDPSTSGGAASTAPASSSPSSPSEAVQAHPSNVATIVGAVFAVLAVLLLLGLAFLYIRHRRNQHRSNVPLSTTMAAPIGRIRSLWSAPPRPPPDMAPVPFPSPVQRVSRTAATGPSSSPSPRPPPPAPSPPSQRSRLSMLSFNPNLLVGRFQRRPPPAPISTLPPPDTRVASPALRSGNPLLREPSAQVEPRDVITSIQQWQLQTLQEAANQSPIHPLDMSEVDLSSHYDSTGDSSAPPPAPPPPLPRSPQPPQRRFTVMNN